MRVAIYSPLPPEQTGIGDYSFELLEALNPLVDLTAVVDDLRLETAVVPEGVSLAGASQVDAASFDCAIYQMGNNSKFHRFVYAQALEVPGLLVMHDPSLADFHTEICGNNENPVFEEEIRFDSPDIDPFDLPKVDIGRGLRDVDRLRVLLGRRIIGASTRTLVNSGGMASELGARYPTADIQTIRLPAQIVFPESPFVLPTSPGEVRIGVFGGINYYKRVRSALEAFRLLRSEFPGARLVVAGRADDKLLEVELRRFAAQPAFGGTVEFETELSLHDLEQEMARCDVAIQLRWPTAGEMSATLMRTFGAGRPAVVTDLPQFSDLDPTFCWPVSPDPAREVEELHGIMRRVAADPDGARRAGEAARAFVEREATYEIVAKAYVEHTVECAEVNKKRPRRRSQQLESVQDGVNVVVATGARTEVLEAADRLRRSLRHAGVPSDLVAVEMPYAEIPTTTQRLHATVWGPWPPRTRREALEWVSHWTSQRGPHATDVLVLDDRFTSRFTEYAHAAHQRGRTVVGLVAPEAEPMAQHFLALVAELDEVWTTSHFGAQVLQGHIDRPVLVVAMMGEDLASGEVRESVVGDPMRVLTVVDASGSLVRANLIGGLRAFQRAFPQHDRGAAAVLTVALVGAAIDSETRTDVQESRDEVRGDDG